MRGTDTPVLPTNTAQAHHLDLRATNPLDPPSLRECRQKEMVAILKWIAQWKANPPTPTDP